MNNKRFIYIRSLRKKEKSPSYHLVYEWENVILDCLKIPLFLENKLCFLHNSIFYILERKIRRGLSLLYSFLQSKYKLQLFFDMSARTKCNPYNRKNIVPIIIDFFVKEAQLPLFYKAYSRTPCVIVTSAEVYAFLQRNKCPLNYYHFPLSIPDIYCHDFNNGKKKWDLVLVGRQNVVLDAFLEIYCNKNTSFVYVRGFNENGHYIGYTNKGEYVAEITERKQYMSLLRQAKMSFYSTPGIDGGENRTNGFNQVTPRFLELIACHCHVLARYKENEDTAFFQINDFCESIQTYEQFENLINSYLTTEVDVDKYESYLKKHCTSVRMPILSKIEQEINEK